MSRRRGLIGTANAYIYEKNAEFYKRKTGGTKSVASGIAFIKEVRGKSIVWNQLVTNGNLSQGTTNWSNGTLQEDGSIGFLGITGATTTLHSNIPTQRGKIAVISLAKVTNATADIRCFTDNSLRFYISSTEYTWEKQIFNGELKSSITATGDNSNLYIKVFMIINLTLMFGVGNEPATVAEFEAMFPLDYYDYNEGEVIPFAGQNLVTTGKNQYNHATGKANLLGGQTYQLLGTYTSATIGGVAVTLDSNNCFTTTKDCVLDVTGGNDTDTIVGLYNGSVTTYAPYESHTLPLDPSQWRDTNDNLVFPYGGMHGYAIAYDNAKVDDDGYIRRAVRVYGSVDLGDYDYTKQGNLYTTSGFIPPKANMLCGRGKSIVWNQKVNLSTYIKTAATTFSLNNDICEIETTKSGNWEFYRTFTRIVIPNGHKIISIARIKSFEEDFNFGYSLLSQDEKAIAVTKNGWTSISEIITSDGAGKYNRYAIGNIAHFYLQDMIFDLTLMFGAGNEPATVAEFEAMFQLYYYAYDAGSLGILANQTYADAAAFKAAVQGVPLIYELATPVEVELATPIYAKYLEDKDGTEEITPANSSTPYTAMTNLSILYHLK